MGYYPAYVATSPDQALAYPHYSDERWHTAQLIYGEKQHTTECNYSDRLWQWDREAAERASAACKDIRARTARHTEAWLSAYHNRPVTLRYIMAGCNLATGYEYYVYGYDYAPDATHARPAELAEIVYAPPIEPYTCRVCGQPTGNPHGWCGCDYILGEEPPPPPALTRETCLQAKPESAFTATLAAPLSSPVVCDACLPPSVGPDARVGATARPFDYDDDNARRTGEALMYEFRMDPAAFLTMLDGFSDRARQAVTRATAAYLEEPIGEVVGLWSESRARLVALGMLA